MTAFKMPNDNVIVDAKGKALPHILPAFRVLERLSRLSSKQIDALIGVVDDEANLLGASGGGAKGDIMYRGEEGWQNLSVGAEGSVLTVVGAMPSYSEPETFSGLFEIDRVSVQNASEFTLDGKGVECSAHIIEIHDLLSAASSSPVEIQVGSSLPVAGVTLNVAATQIVSPATTTSELVDVNAYRVTFAHPTKGGAATIRVQRPMEVGAVKMMEWNGLSPANRWYLGYAVINTTDAIRGYRFVPNPALTMASGTAVLYGVA